MLQTVMDYASFQTKIGKYNLPIVKLDIVYNRADCRCWSAIVDNNDSNIIVTYHVNKQEFGTSGFDILSSDKIILDVSEDDVFDLIEDLTAKSITVLTTEE